MCFCTILAVQRKVDSECRALNDECSGGLARLPACPMASGLYTIVNVGLGCCDVKREREELFFQANFLCFSKENSGFVLNTTFSMQRPRTQ
ncbi:hypothetical protein AVEN_20593-1 [Araneus ventricosus]|uniref:Uncharacterized protein n=1 Tax=Araneus ventricosus TaxID=182803 RepID=A0A4Y2HZ59_ARAVE|nr:hypothetical protein AVEN_20593-1 [Araneus ventricosus]